MDHWAVESYLSVVSDLLDDCSSTGHQINIAMMLLIGSLHSLSTQGPINEVVTRLMYYSSSLVHGPSSPLGDPPPQSVRSILRDDTRKLKELIISQKNVPNPGAASPRVAGAYTAG
jgi:hypothetical protein